MGRLIDSAVARFALSGAVAVALLGVVVAEVVAHQGRKEAIAQAKEVTRLAGVGVVAPDLTQALLAGDPAAQRRLDGLVRRRVLREPVVRVKVWTPGGRIAYSDEPRLVGHRFRLGPEEAAALRSGRIEAEVSDLDHPENRFERPFGRLLEVYLPVRARGGSPLLFEAYLRYSAVTASGERLWRAFAPAILLALLALWIVQIPMASRMARRLRRSRAEREELLHRALEASTVERRRIARDLHDGPVQQLAAVSYGLGGAGGLLRARGDEETAAIVDHAAAAARHSIRQLRTMLVDLYPPTLQQAGLQAAIGDLLEPLRARGVATELRVEAAEGLAVSAESLIYRTAQEALRNVGTHAGAGRVSVSVSGAGGTGVLEVTDDGAGFDPDALAAAEDHFGLRMLGDVATDAGGRLEVRSAPGAGTTVRLEVPA
jgi:two-component system, NarL family, sensor kinase